jgi:hypothetical protein
MEREPTDIAVQEAMLAVPHAYASLNVHGRAALARCAVRDIRLRTES